MGGFISALYSKFKKLGGNFMKKRIISFMLALVMTLALVPTMGSTPVNAEEENIIVTTVSARGDHNLAIKSDGSLWVWGANRHRQLGDITTERESTIPIKIMDGVTAVSAGFHFNMAIKKDGSLWAWGDNWWGQLGDDTRTHKLTPVKVMDDVIAVSAGYTHSLAIKSDGSLWAWGDPGSGKLGIGNIRVIITPVKVMDDVIARSVRGISIVLQ
jgi:alpha-tubulin suppressor-like RCC1 family protein